MKIGIKHLCVILLFITCIYSCKTPYTPAPIIATNNYLVVEGLINIADSTYINLNRTATLKSATAVKPELRAVVSIESSTGATYSLKELGLGRYAASNLNLDPNNQYRLRIKTLNGNTYVSDFAETKVSPPIDSISWIAKVNGLYININTHDPQNNSRYYRWDFNETWEIYTIPPDPTAPPDHCWGTQNSSEVLLGTSATLSNDIIKDQPLTFIPEPSEKISYRYSIVVKQYALTKDAYDFWTLLKRNTEQLGSIFDNQPSASIGNLHNVNKPQESVIGFINAGTVSSLRIFINRATQLPPKYFLDYYANGLIYCNPTSRLGGSYVLQDCADCTMKPKNPPAFW
jgi:hypothetical protein